MKFLESVIEDIAAMSAFIISLLFGVTFAWIMFIVVVIPILDFVMKIMGYN